MIIKTQHSNIHLDISWRKDKHTILKCIWHMPKVMPQKVWYWVVMQGGHEVFHILSFN